MPMSVRDEVQRFAEVMEQKLRENDHKGHWLGCPFEQLAQRLVEEFGELFDAVNAGQHPVNVAREAADVANFAMMIADNYRRERDGKAKVVALRYEVERYEPAVPKCATCKSFILGVCRYSAINLEKASDGSGYCDEHSELRKS